MGAARERALLVNDRTYAAWNAPLDCHRHAPGRAVRDGADRPQVRVEGATFSRLGVDGLVVEDVHFWDVAGLMAQLTG
jgi:hypothetical protein